LITDKNGFENENNVDKKKKERNRMTKRKEKGTVKMGKIKGGIRNVWLQQRK
jgi:hypothetical protein